MEIKKEEQISENKKVFESQEYQIPEFISQQSNIEQPSSHKRKENEISDTKILTQKLNQTLINKIDSQLYQAQMMSDGQLRSFNPIEYALNILLMSQQQQNIDKNDNDEKITVKQHYDSLLQQKSILDEQIKAVVLQKGNSEKFTRILYAIQPLSIKIQKIIDWWNKKVSNEAQDIQKRAQKSGICLITDEQSQNIPNDILQNTRLSKQQIQIQQLGEQIMKQDELLEQLEFMENLEFIILEIENVLRKQQEIKQSFQQIEYSINYEQIQRDMEQFYQQKNIDQNINQIQNQSEIQKIDNEKLKRLKFIYKQYQNEALAKLNEFETLFEKILEAKSENSILNENEKKKDVSYDESDSEFSSQQYLNQDKKMAQGLDQSYLDDLNRRYTEFKIIIQENVEFIY